MRRVERLNANFLVDNDFKFKEKKNFVLERFWISDQVRVLGFYLSVFSLFLAWMEKRFGNSWKTKLLHNASHFQVSSRCLEMSPNGLPCTYSPKVSSDGEGVFFYIFFRSLLGEIYLDNS